MNPGIYTDLSNEQYHADPAISRSGIMDFLSSPYKYWANYINSHKPPKKTTDAMEFGSAFHMYVLEPEIFCVQYGIEPEKVLLKKVGEEKYRAYKKELENFESVNKTLGRKTLSAAEYYVLQEMKIALQNHQEAWELIEGAVYEHSYFWQDVHSGLMVKARPDILHPNIIVDLKTCANASSHAYQRSMVDGGYHIQGAIIRDGIYELTGDKIDNVINICIEKTYPWSVAIKIIDVAALEAGHCKYKQALLDMKECFNSNVWASYQPEIVGLPAWAI